MPSKMTTFQRLRPQEEIYLEKLRRDMRRRRYRNQRLMAAIRNAKIALLALIGPVVIFLAYTAAN